MRTGPANFALLLTAALVACGDDGGPRLIDSGIGNTDVLKVCTAVTAIGAMEKDVIDEVLATDPVLLKAGSISYYADVGTINGDPAYLYMDFYHTTSMPTLPATVDITEGSPNADYLKCTTCFQVITFDANASTLTVKKRFFSQSGSLSFTGDPVTARHATVQFSNLQLREFTLDQNTGATVFNPIGDCVTLNGSFDDDNIPNDWTCPATDYYQLGTNACQCNCGAFDPDCRVPGVTQADCTQTATPICWPDDAAGSVCRAGVTNDTCLPAATIAVGTTAVPIPVNGDTTGAVRNYNKGLNAMTCTKYGQPGPDVAYQVMLNSGTAYTVTLTGLSPTHDASISLVGPAASISDTAVCSDNITACVKGYDEGYEGDDETFTYTPTATGYYYVIVDSYNVDQAGPFTLTVTGP